MSEDSLSSTELNDTLPEDNQYKYFKKIKNQLDLSNKIIETYKLKNAKLQMELNIQAEQFNKKIKDLNDQIYSLKSESKIEQYKNCIQNLYNSRQNVLLSKIENKAIREQIKIELEIIKNQKSLLTELFENLYENSASGDNSESFGSVNNIAFEVEMVLQKLKESRERLSIYMDKTNYISFINSQKDVLFTIEMLKKKSPNLSVDLSNTSYEKWILREKDYIYFCERHSDMYQRLIYSQLFTELKPFELYNDFSEIHFTASMKDLLNNILVTSLTVSGGLNNISVSFGGLNNICFVENDIFLVLDCISENTSGEVTRFWTYDCYLLNTIRNLSKKMYPLFVSEFRRFYKDCFSHNKYIHNFSEILSQRQIKRWKQYKILYENIRILADEYMFGEIVRDVIRKNCQYKPQEGDNSKASGGVKDNSKASGGVKDIIKGYANSSVLNDFQDAQIYFSKGSPYIDEQEYIDDLFDSLVGFDEKEFNIQYRDRWREFLKLYYK